MTDIKERLRIVSQSPRSFDTALLKDALGEIERLEIERHGISFFVRTERLMPNRSYASTAAAHLLAGR